jgi:hypothetical protein
MLTFFFGFYHLLKKGGVHSGSGLSALLWLTLGSSIHFQNPSEHNIIILISLGICEACMYLTCLAAFPFIRGRHHKYDLTALKTKLCKIAINLLTIQNSLFEMIHRFVGW